MNPYTYVQDATVNGESLLSLCCGIGMELNGSASKDITAVDAAPQYLTVINANRPSVKTICSEALDFLVTQPDSAYDVISIIDGIEHMEKDVGLEVIEHMKRVCKREILLFTPQGQGEDGYLKNEPHNAWGIEGADHFQTHKSGWTQGELEDLGFDLIKGADGVSQHGEPYKALMMIYRK